MIKLTIDQEIEILENLGEFIANGSSRAVYEYDDDYVVKVALDRKGQYQNNVEVKNYRAHGDLHLARIQSYGKHIVVMEKVEELNYYTIMNILRSEYYNEFVESNTNEEGFYYYKDESIDEDLFYKIHETVNALDKWNGSTADNCQIGIVGNRVVAYDYGFESGSFDKCVSNFCELGYALENVSLAVLDILKRKGRFKEILDNYGLVSSKSGWWVNI
jgi:hypothetical protein